MAITVILVQGRTSSLKYHTALVPPYDEGSSKVFPRSRLRTIVIKRCSLSVRQ